MSGHPRDILIVKPSSLGDVVHTLPSVAVLRRAFPEAKLRWLANTEWMPLLEGNPHIDEVIEFPRRNFRGVAGPFKMAPWARELAERVHADLILDYQGLLRSAFISKMCRGAESRTVGLSDAREGARFFYDQVVDVSDCTHAVDRYLALTRDVTGMEDVGELLWPLPESRPAGDSLAEPFVVLHPFSRGKGKSLSLTDVVTFCEQLTPYRVVLAGRSDEPVPELANLTNLLNATSLPELVWLLRAARFVVSVDSGPMHMAAAVNERLVSIHTWSDPSKVGPYRPAAWVWKAGRLFQQLAAADPAAHKEVANISALAEFVREQL